MNVLFVSSGNKGNNTGKPGAVVYNQGESLKRTGVNVDYFLVKGKGLRGYVREVYRLQEYLKNHSIDIIHAHYTLSGWVAVLTLPKQPVILSLMGTDVYGEYIGANKILNSSRYLIFLTYMIQPFVRFIICKTDHIQSIVYLKSKARIIPNGVSLGYINDSKKDYFKEFGLENGKKYVLFLSDIKDKNKNFQLLDKAFKMVDSKNSELIAPYPIPHKQVFEYCNSADVLVVTSFREGSPNVVKEAMICNCPVVATDVGDIKWLFGDEPGYFITSFDPEDVADKIQQALTFAEKYGRTKGRNRIIELELDSEKVAKKIIQVYKEALDKSSRL